MAGSLKRQEVKLNEDIVLIRAMRDNTGFKGKILMPNDL